MCLGSIGLALPYSSGTPAPYEERDKYAFESGIQVMELLKQKIRPRDIVTIDALKNAVIVAAKGQLMLRFICQLSPTNVKLNSISWMWQKFLKRLLILQI